MSIGKTPYHEAFDFLTAKVTTRPKVGIVCGSGLGGFADTLTDVIRFNYSEIPHFPVSTVEGHKVLVLLFILLPRACKPFFEFKPTLALSFFA